MSAKFWATFSPEKSYLLISPKMGWAAVWAIFS
jgi:hypothetical protein